MPKPGRMLMAVLFGACLLLTGVGLLRVGLLGSDWRVIPGAACATFGLYFAFFSVEFLRKRERPHQPYRGMRGSTYSRGLARNLE